MTDSQLMDDKAFDEFHGHLSELPEPPDYIREREMEELRKKYHIGENDEKL